MQAVACRPHPPSTQHVHRAQALNKPLLLEEFGVWSGGGDEQQRFYDLIYKEIAAVSAKCLAPCWCFPSESLPRRSCRACGQGGLPRAL